MVHEYGGHSLQYRPWYHVISTSIQTFPQLHLQKQNQLFYACCKPKNKTTEYSKLQTDLQSEYIIALYML